MRSIAIIALCLLLMQVYLPAAAEEGNTLPTTENTFYNMNFDWKFAKPTDAFPLAAAQKSIMQGEKNFYDTDYDDTAWESVSVPHAPNSADSFDSLIADAGEGGLYRGFMFYRKHFTLSSADAAKKAILEFEAVRQSIYLYVNGTFIGYYEAGVAPVGFDIGTALHEGENVIALASDNAAYRGAKFTTQETVPGNTPGDASGASYQWNQKDFNEVQGGITGNVNLYLSGMIYQTRPLYNNLKTHGNYIYAQNFDIERREADITFKAQVRNESGRDETVLLKVYIKDGERVVAAFESSGEVKSAQPETFKCVVPTDAYSENPAPTNADTIAVSYISATARVSDLHFWSIDEPHLYDVYSVLYVNGEARDMQKCTTGFRKVEYDAKRGLLINDVPTYLKGYAQRATNEWAVIGVANDWLSDYDMELLRDSNANFVRWMHVSPKPVAIRAGDKYGVVSVCPAGDKEGDTNGRSWDMRVEAMRDAILYFRNSPSVIFYEAGNAAISAQHMQEMTDMRRLLDPEGGRYMGCRSITNAEQLAAAEWVGTMIYRYDGAAKATMEGLNRYMPMLETEFKRDEAPRRVWDDYSPPDYDYNNKWLGNGAKKTDGYDIWDLTQEDYSRALASEGDGYMYFYNNRIGGGGNDYYSGAAMMVWSDSNMHGRNAGSENCRTSGKVDAVRIKKDSFYALRAMQSDGADVHILGHWNYPQVGSGAYEYPLKAWNGTFWEPTGEKALRNPTEKTVYVAASPLVAKVDLYVNGTLVGECDTPRDGVIYEFENVDVTKSGTVSAKAYSAQGKLIAHDKIETASKPFAIRLTAHTGNEGLRADGSDVCFIDVEIVDSEGRVCPTANDKISFAFEGDGTFLGGYNSGKFGDESVIHKDFCFAECGVNRVFVRSAKGAKSFTLKAAAEGIKDAEITLDYTPFDTTLTSALQQSAPKNTFTKKTTLLDLTLAQNVAEAKAKTVKQEAAKYFIKNAQSGKYLANDSGNLALSDTPTVWLIKESKGVCTMQDAQSGKNIDVPAFSKDDGKAVSLYTPNGGDNQKWIIGRYSDKVSFTAKHSALCLDASQNTVAQRTPSESEYQKWYLEAATQRDEYEVLVNGKRVRFASAPYRPDSSSGVVCSVSAVLDALGISYSLSGTPLTLTADGGLGSFSISEGKTEIISNADSSLMNAEVYAENGDLFAEISAVMAYVKGSEVKMDSEKHIMEITK